MAMVKGPLFSLQASGTFGRTITFQKRPSGTAVFIPKSPYDPKSINQLAHRDYIQRGIYYFHKLSPAYIQSWKDFVK